MPNVLIGPKVKKAVSLHHYPVYQPWEQGMGASQDVEDGPLLPGFGNTE